MTVPLYDWPRCIIPSASIIRDSGNVIDGFVSRASYENDRPIAGGRQQLRMEFHTVSPERATVYSWVVNNLRKGRFYVPVRNAPQLATSAAIAAAEAAYISGNPFSTGSYFSTGYGFLFNPTVDVAAAALEGTDEIVLDESRWPGALVQGKVFGVGRAVYHVDDIVRDGDVATVTFHPPLRRDIAEGELATLRPKMVCKPADIGSFVVPFDRYGYARPGTLVMNEVVDEAYV